MTPDDLTADQVHRFDQAHAIRTQHLATLTDVMRDDLRVLRREYAIIDTADTLAAEMHPGVCAELLACALEQLARQPPRTGDSPGASHPA